jgi:hypothetical protein
MAGGGGGGVEPLGEANENDKRNTKTTKRRLTNGWAKAKAHECERRQRKWAEDACL